MNHATFHPDPSAAVRLAEAGAGIIRVVAARLGQVDP